MIEIVSNDTLVRKSIDTLVHANYTDSQLDTHCLKQNGQLVTRPWKHNGQLVTEKSGDELTVWWVDWLPKPIELQMLTRLQGARQRWQGQRQGLGLQGQSQRLWPWGQGRDQTAVAGAVICRLKHLPVTVPFIHCVQKKHPLSFSFISQWKMFRFIQNFQGMFKMNKVFRQRKS